MVLQVYIPHQSGRGASKSYQYRKSAPGKMPQHLTTLKKEAYLQYVGSRFHLEVIFSLKLHQRMGQVATISFASALTSRCFGL